MSYLDEVKEACASVGSLDGYILANTHVDNLIEAVEGLVEYANAVNNFRNPWTASDRRDALPDWVKEMLK